MVESPEDKYYQSASHNNLAVFHDCIAIVQCKKIATYQFLLPPVILYRQVKDMHSPMHNDGTEIHTPLTILLTVLGLY